MRDLLVVGATRQLCGRAQWAPPTRSSPPRGRLREGDSTPTTTSGHFPIVPNPLGVYPHAVATFIYTMRDGRNRGTTAGTKYDATLTPFGLSAAITQSQFLYRRDSRIDQRFGLARCPIAAGDSGDPASGFVFGPGFRQWILDTMDAGRTVRIALSVANSYTTHSASAGGHQGPVIQSGHVAGQILFRVRYKSADGYLETYIGENSGTTTVPILSISNSVYTSLDSDIATKDGNFTEWYVQMTPNDPGQSSWVGEKHNMYVAARTVDPSGASVFPITNHRHYDATLGFPTGAVLPRMPISDQPITLGRTSDTATTPGGTIGDFVSVYADDGADSSVVTDAATIGTYLDGLWRGLRLEDVNGLRSRGRGRFRAA